MLTGVESYRFFLKSAEPHYHSDRCSPCSAPRRTARFGMRMPFANAHSATEAYYARNNLNKSSPCSHRTQRETARFGMRMPFANARSPSLSFGDYARNKLNKRSPCSHRTQRETARFGMGILLTKARSPSLSFGDYARNNLRATARFGMRMPFQKKARVKPCVLKLTLTLASVRKRRFELPRLLPRYHLKVVRLPISPPPQGVQTYYNLANFNVPRKVFRLSRRRCDFGGNIFNPEKFFLSRRASARENFIY